MNDNKAQKLKRKTKNYNSKLKTFTLLAVTLRFALFPLRFASPTFALTESISNQIVVTASIGEPRLTLFGYTSPYATVYLEGGASLFAETMARSDGFFIFENLFVLGKVGDYCLYGQDREERVTGPVCLPPLPDGPFLTNIGPVILPPTLSLSKGNFLAGEQVVASGETIPSSETKIALFKKEKSPLFVRRIYAFSLPEYQVASDKNGYFSFNLPSVSTNLYRLFASSFWENRESPKSNTLTFKVVTIWEWLVLKIKTLLRATLGLFRPSNLSLIILGEAFLILFLLKRRYLKTKLVFSKKTSIPQLI